MSSVFHEPTGRLWAEKDTEAEKEGWDEGRSELETPSDVTSVFDNDVGGETQEDTWTRQFSRCLKNM